MDIVNGYYLLSGGAGYNFTNITNIGNGYGKGYARGNGYSHGDGNTNKSITENKHIYNLHFENIIQYWLI